MEARAPDDVCRVDDLVVFHSRQPVAHADCPGNAFHPGGIQVAGLDADRRGATGEDLWARSAADGGVHGEHAVEHEPEHQGCEEKPRGGALDTERHVTGVPARQPGAMRARQLERDLGSRIASPHDEDNEQAASQPDPERRLQMVAHANRQQWELGAGLVAIYQGAAAADREAAAELEEELRGRRSALDRIVEGLEETLRPGLDASSAATILRAAGRVEVYKELMAKSGLSPDKYACWLGESLKRQFVTEAASCL